MTTYLAILTRHMDKRFISTPLIIIIGPTASGKSAFGTLLAEAINGIIINGDMAQMYEPLTIGTAKPLWRQERVPHLLFDSINEPRDSSALEFRNKTSQAVRDVVDAGSVPIIVGGSLFHISTLFFALDDGVPENDADDISAGALGIGETAAGETDIVGPADADAMALWRELALKDLTRASKLHPQDTYRVKRALAILRHKKASDCMPQFRPIYNNCVLIHITRDRNELYTRINQRVCTMISDGWLEEVKGLSPEWGSWLKRKKIIGYDSLLDVTTISPQDISAIQKRTRNYAKRQLTFWRSFERKLRAQSFHDIIECDLTLLPVDLYLEKVLTFLDNMR